MVDIINATFNMTLGVEKLLAGDIFGGVMYPFEALMGSLIYLIFYGIALVLIYIKLEDKGVISVVMMITSPIMIPLLPPNVQIFFWVLFLLGVAGTIYKVFTS
jgi:hypothetical protein